MEGARAKYVSTWLCTAVCAGILLATAVPALAQASGRPAQAYFGATEPPSFTDGSGSGAGHASGDLTSPTPTWSNVSTVSVRDEGGNAIVGSRVRFVGSGKQGLATPITPGTFYITDISGKVTLTVEPSPRTKTFDPQEVTIMIPSALIPGRGAVTAVTIDVIAGHLVTSIESSTFGANELTLPPQPVGPGCPGAGGDCCSADGTPGCDDIVCCTLVCGMDPFCCDVAWDGICASEAQANCAVCAGPPPAGCGDCNVPDPAGAPGCSDPVCQAIVCAVDPFCCDVAWDGICADEAIANCNCGGGGGGDCGDCNVPDPAGAPGCSDPVCQGIVCAIDPFCCDISWDGICANEAIANCDCGGGGASNCCVPNGGIGCDDPACQAAVCAVDPFCCDIAWDGICAAEAAEICEVCGGSPPPPPSDCLTCANNEGEPCGSDTNGGCNSIPPVFGSISCNGAAVCGTSWAAGGTRDTDWYTFCTSGSTNATANLTSEGGSHVLFIVGGIEACAPVVLGVAGSAPAGCGAGTAATATVGAGTFVVFVAPDVFDGQPCDGVDDYSVTLTTNVACSVPCEIGPPPDPCAGASGDCCQEGGIGTPGCGDPDCCAAICAIDPFCCDVAWDGICADEAQANPVCGCGGPPPGGSNCCTEGGNGGVGCDDPECQAMVCAVDPFCCDIAWDGICADEAQAMCAVCQGGGGCGDCNVPDPGGAPGCSDPVCQAIVCAIDPFCCDIAWDGICANEAIANCDCGGVGNPACNPDAGPCCSADGTPGCNDPECCEAVCAADPFCCDVAWDGICAGAAAGICEVCAPSDCLTCTNNEGEPCGDDTNGGCNSIPPEFGSITSCPATICGTIWATGGTRDTDWFAFGTTVASQSVTLSGTSEVDAVLFIVDGIAACAPVVVGVTGSAPANCGAGTPASATLGLVGTYVAFIAPSAFEGAPCGGSNDYTITLTSSAACGEPPPPPPPPENDLCGDAQSISLPSMTAGTTVQATNDGQPGCGGATPQGSNGVWYSLIGTGNTITLSTCGGATFDTQISVWCGECPAGPSASNCCIANGGVGCDDPECEAIVCAVDPFCCDVAWDGLCAGEAQDLCEICAPAEGGLTCVAGNDDFCGLQTQVSFCSQNGAEYLILVYGFGSAQGPFTMTATQAGSCTTTLQCIDLGACCYCDENHVELCTDVSENACAALGGDWNTDDSCADQFLGYATADCTNPFLNIAGTGTLAPLASSSDDNGDVVPIGFTFNYFGSAKTTVGIASNGYLTFGAVLGDFSNDPIPNAATPNDMIAPYWDDWNPAQANPPAPGNSVFYQTLGAAPNRVFVAQWNAVDHFNGGLQVSTFEALLHESSNCVEFRYGDITLVTPSIGIENAGGTVGSSVPAASIVDNDCVSFCPQTAEGYDCEADEDTTCIIILPVDIKNGACPAPFNRTSNGVTPVAILSGGAEGVDAAAINVATVAISRCDGVGGSVAPSPGPQAVAPKLLPAGTPTAELAECGGCACHDQSNDGLKDLTMHFSNDAMTNVLELGNIADGAIVPLKVSGSLNDGTPFESYDCIELVPPGGNGGGGGQAAQLVVESNLSNAWVDVSPLDGALDGGGWANFTRLYPMSQLVTLQMQMYQGESPLLGWELNGVFTPIQPQVTLPSVSVKTTVQVGGISTFKAVYKPTKNVPPMFTPPGSNPAPSNGGKASIGG